MLPSEPPQTSLVGYLRAERERRLAFPLLRAGVSGTGVSTGVLGTVISRCLATSSPSLMRAATMKISGSPPPMTPTAILIESGSVMRMAWQKMSINLSMSFLPAKLKERLQLNLRASRRETSKHGHERQRLSPTLMSAYGPKPDMLRNATYVAIGGKADMPFCGVSAFFMLWTAPPLRHRSASHNRSSAIRVKQVSAWTNSPYC